MKKTKKLKKGKSKIRRVINPNAGGIDIAGSGEHYVAVPENRTDNNVRCFESFTEDLYRMADWLLECKIETVAVESTGVYWIPVFQVLESRGIKVCLVNSKHVRHVPGRKTDVMDCQWLQYLHSVGLLNASFRPPQEICAIRNIRRQRDNVVGSASTFVQRMQKSLDQMNLKLHFVISDITGETGMKIINAILAGERSPEKLAELKNNRIKASKKTLRKALHGDYLPEHLFTLKQNLDAYKYCQSQIEDCDIELKRLLSEIKSTVDPEDKPLEKKSKRQGSKEPDFELRKELYRIFGVDLTQIDGISILTAYMIFSEIGANLSDFDTEGHFVSWLGLCPGSNQSSGKILSRRTRKVDNRVSKALRMAAQSMHHAKCALGEYYRRMRAKLGGPKAITATAAKLARIIYKMITTRTSFDETMFSRNEKLYQKRRLSYLRKQAKEFGLELVSAQEVSNVVS